MTGCAALVLAGGSGSRFGGETPKQYQSLAGKAVLRHAVDAFRTHPKVDFVRVVLRPGDQAHYDTSLDDIAGEPGILPPVDGGETRQDSTRLGLQSLKDLNPDMVLIHDGARPFPNGDLISRTLTALKDHPGIIPALPISDTVKRAEGKENLITGTIDRSGLWRAQTPQAFRYRDILAAHDKARGQEMTDDAMIAEHAGLAVALVMGHEDNIKITTQEDMTRADRILGHQQVTTRVGTGFDVHAFCPGDHVVLGGVRIDHDFSLEGHSDADAALHALTDAVLGAIGDGDIGTHFPPSDPQWRDAASSAFLSHAARLVRDRGGDISNVDVTIICERPKILPHRDAMRTAIAAMLEIDETAVSIKATTTEGLGFTGRREGIAAQAIAAVRLPSA